MFVIMKKFMITLLNIKGLIVLLNKLKSRLSEDFPTGKFDLVHYTDYEYSDWSYILLYVKVDDYTFNNGVMEDIKKLLLILFH